MYHYNFSGVACYVNIFLEIDGLKSKTGNWSLCASYEGKINRLEKFQVLGIARIIAKHTDKYTQKKENYTEIIIEQNNYYAKFEVLIRDDVTFGVEILSDINHHKDINLNKIF